MLVLALSIVYWYYESKVLLLVGAGLALIGLFIPLVARWVHFLWMKIAEVLGFIMSKLLLGLVYVIVVIPLSTLAKIFRKDQSICLRPKDRSYFHNRNFTYNKESLENIW